jgi:alpha-aminoadipate/glutamate carrier protein LysW
MSYQPVVCPECEGELTLDNPMVGEILPCAYCGVDLEVTSLDPLRLEMAPEVEEDWGE